MLSKKQRIPRELFNNELIRNPYFKPDFGNTEHFSLRSVPSSSGASHLSVSVSKKTAKKAVVRNRIRRRTYSAASPFFAVLKPRLYLVTAKPGAEKIKGDALIHEIKKLFAKFLPSN